MKKILLAVGLVVLVPLASAAEPFCKTNSVHPIDAQFEREMAASGGITEHMRNAQGRAYEQWDRELNIAYKELMSHLSADEKDSLRKAQKAWLVFRDAETEFFWSESISGGGTLQPIIVSDYSLELLKTRVCQLSNFVPVDGEGGWPVK
ncbi:MAG TPA: lysozyme inhibitor LprI family protein [Thiopseudomonas sp.]|nr:lysozyme inhibitor LprI family protein [Thiopseudomonas sp.]